MPRFFFDVHDGAVSHDEDGLELPDIQAVREAAMDILPPIVADEIRKDGDHRHFVVLVTNDEGHPVYSATMSYIGMWLRRP